MRIKQFPHATGRNFVVALSWSTKRVQWQNGPNVVAVEERALLPATEAVVAAEDAQAEEQIAISAGAGTGATDNLLQ